MADRPRIFWDADALFAGLYSPTGGAGLLLTATEAGTLIGILADHVVEQVERNLSAKAPATLPKLTTTLATIPFERVNAPSPEDRADCLSLAHADDAANVASAKAASAVYLLTYNLRHYQAARIAEVHGISVLNPGALIQELRLRGVLSKPSDPATEKSGQPEAPGVGD